MFRSLGRQRGEDWFLRLHVIIEGTRNRSLTRKLKKAFPWISPVSDLFWICFGSVLHPFHIYSTSVPYLFWIEGPPRTSGEWRHRYFYLAIVQSSRFNVSAGKVVYELPRLKLLTTDERIDRLLLPLLRVDPRAWVSDSKFDSSFGSFVRFCNRS